VLLLPGNTYFGSTIRFETLVMITSFLVQDSGSGACYKNQGMKLKCVGALYREVILVSNRSNPKAALKFSILKMLIPT
jgi:hypothetical protein